MSLIKFNKIKLPRNAVDLSSQLENAEGLQYWRNKRNSYAVAVVHFTSDPNKRTDEWFIEETKNLRQDKIDREYHIDFSSKAGQKAFWYLKANPNKFLVPDIPLDKIPKSWRIIAALDYGTTLPTSIHFYAINQANRMYSIFEFYEPSNAGEIAKVLKGEHPGYPHKLWKRCEKVMADPAIWKGDQNKDDGSEEMESVADLIEAKGIYNLTRATNARLAGLDRIHEQFNYQPNNPDFEPYLFICRRCKEQWRELNGMVYDEVDPAQLVKKNPKEDVVAKDDHCVIAGTLVSTISGKKPIEFLRKGEMVLTRNGYYPILECGQTGIQPTIKLVFSNGSNLICTENHQIYTENRGFVRADEINKQDTFLGESQCRWKKFSIKESCLGAIQNLKELTIKSISNVIQTTSALGYVISIEKSGNLIMGQFLKTTKSITETEIPPTMKSPTLSASLKANTQGSIGRRLRIGLKGTGKSWFTEFVFCAVKSIRHLKWLENLKDIAVLSVVEPETITLLGREKCSQSAVYNLSVATQPEFFANGILVHNCYDELRYAVMSVAQPAPENEEKEEEPNDWSLNEVEKETVEHYDEEEDDGFF